jgi:tetratricopeptide (TPR) repeat protein
VELQVNSLLALLAWVHLENGDVERAEEMLRASLPRAAAQEDRLSWVDMSRVLGMALARQGRTAEAIEVLEGAAAEAAPMPYPQAHARILLQLASLHEQEGDKVRARERRVEAREIGLRLGARLDLEEATAALT